MSKRKYLSEFAVNIHTGRWLIMPASEITSDKTRMPDENSKQVLDNSHIYLLTKFPRLAFSPITFKYIDNVIYGDFMYKMDGKEKFVPFKFSPTISSENVSFELSTYPHREILMKNDDGETTHLFPANLLFFNFGFHTQYDETKNLEVLYIGQAYGDGKRRAIDRLKSHSTLQKILADSQHSFPDSEIYVLMYEYMDPVIFTSMDGIAKDTINDYRDINRFHSIIDKPLTKPQVISLMEAGLIRYFQPTYNKVYKDNFPSTSHQILNECYTLDFSALVVEIDTEELGFTLYSDNVKPNSHHMSNIELINPDERWGFFHMSLDEDSVIKLSGIIPIKK